MGSLLAHPIRDKETIEDATDKLYCGLCSMQGWRVDMEDSHIVQMSLDSPFQQWSFFAIFDGHNGYSVAKLCSEKILSFILGTPEFVDMRFDHDGSPCNTNSVEVGIRRAFHQFDRYIRQQPEFRRGLDRSGSTATALFVTPKFLFFINCGDSRGMLIREGRSFFSTRDHKPECKDEANRIYQAGGSVIGGRINGSLAVSRCLGDFPYKESDVQSDLHQMVSPDPEVTTIRRHSSDLDDAEFGEAHDQMAVLACDGIWDVMTAKELTDFVVSRSLCISSPRLIAEEVVDLCYYKDSKDNMSIIILNFAPKMPANESFELEDTVLNKSLFNVISDHVTRYPHASHTEMLKVLTNFDFPNIPPGGLLSKRYLIDQIFHQLTTDEIEHLTPEILRQRNFMDFSDISM